MKREQLSLIESGVRLVQHCARRTLRVFYTAEFEDLIAAGMEALVHAAKRYCTDHATRFTSFAYYRIRGAMVECAIKQLPASIELHRMVVEHDKLFPDDRPTYYDILDEPVASLQRWRNVQRIRASLAKLEERQRVVLTRHYFRGDALATIAEDLGRSRSWASRAHSEALGVLRELKLVA